MECPWDREQTHQTLKTYILEEVYEVLESIDNDDDEGLKEELGDLQIQILFHAIVARERKKFSLEDVFNRVNDKLIHRHPHVYGDTQVNGTKQVLENWEQLKKKENKDRKSMFDSVPGILPALLKAFRVQSKAARVGFDWPDISGVWEKINEETDELRVEIEAGEQEKVREEMGDLLFSIVNLARFLKVDPEDALRLTTDKFIKRFNYIEQELKKSGRTLQDSTLREMDEIWERAKEV